MSENVPAWLILLVAIIGGGGLAAIGGVVVTYLKNRTDAVVDERSVTIAEIEKAMPGLGDIITQLRAQNAWQQAEMDRLKDRNHQLVGEVANLERRVADLEAELANARS